MRHYAEHIVHLPHTFQSNDIDRPIKTEGLQRTDYGLPEQGTVFCCFNNNFKITPDVFDAWMRILSRVENSVLWLREGGPTVAKNLQSAASEHGIDPTRLIFAHRVENPAEHLGRHRLADLFLDTFYYNAHTTASDALWAGLPVITWMNDTYAGRVAGSLLHAIDMQELIAPTQEAYVSLAVELAGNREKLDTIRQKLADNKHTQPLFDTQKFIQHIEAAYTTMFSRRQKGLRPERFAIADSGSS